MIFRRRSTFTTNIISMGTLEKINNTIDIYRKQLFDDFYKFVRYVDARNDINEPIIKDNGLFRKLCSELQKGNSYYLILLPRKWGKTTLIVLYCVWYMLKNPNKTIAIYTATYSLVMNIVSSIKRFFTNSSKILALFGNDLLASVGNTGGKITLKSRTTLKKEPNLIAHTSESQSATGSRANVMIFDDYINEKFITFSAIVRERLLKNYKYLYATIEKNSPIIYVGTLYDKSDIPSQILLSVYETHDKVPAQIVGDKHDNWTFFKMAALNGDNQPTYPEIMDADEINNIRKAISNDFIFYSQYMNTITNPETYIFDTSNYSVFMEFPNIQKVIVGVDLSDGAGGDKNAIVVVGEDDGKLLYVLDAYGNNKIFGNALFHIIKQYYDSYKTKCVKVVVELNRNGKTLMRDVFMKLNTETGSQIPFEGITNMTNKNIRLRNMKPLFDNKIICLPNKAYINYKFSPESINSLLLELNSFNFLSKTNKDDMMDALSIAINAFQRENTIRNEGYY